MNFDYQLQESDELYFLKERHRKTNVLYFVLFALFYSVVSFPMIKHFWMFLVVDLFFICLLAIILWICNFVFTKIELKLRQKNRKEGYLQYHFAVTKRGISQSQGSFKREVLWKDIRKVKIRKSYIFIEPKKDSVAFLFQKKTLGDRYPKLVETIQENMKNE